MPVLNTRAVSSLLAAVIYQRAYTEITKLSSITESPERHVSQRGREPQHGYQALIRAGTVERGPWAETEALTTGSLGVWPSVFEEHARTATQLRKLTERGLTLRNGEPAERRAVATLQLPAAENMLESRFVTACRRRDPLE
jgi:hypothetical protein